MRSKFKRILAVIGLTGLLAVPAGAAWAEPPVTLDPATKIVDSAGVLGSKKAAVQEAIKKLGTDHATVLHVVTVKKFENPTDREAWTDEVAKKANLGPNALIFAVATETRQYILNSSVSVGHRRARGEDNPDRPHPAAAGWGYRVHRICPAVRSD